MTFRSKSRTWQWVVWILTAQLAILLYVVLSQVLFDSVSLNLMLPRAHRIALPLVALWVFIAIKTRWDGIVRDGGRSETRVSKKVAPVQPVIAENQATNVEAPAATMPPIEITKIVQVPVVPQATPTVIASPIINLQEPTPAMIEATGKELFEKAREMIHQVIPDFVTDEAYLKLLGRSAALGYAPAMAKLGDYAIRRGAWVEAYYWMSAAKLNGMMNLDNVMREIRRNWSYEGYPKEDLNIHPVFTLEQGSIGRALLGIDSGSDSFAAKKFLRDNHPEFLTQEM